MSKYSSLIGATIIALTMPIAAQAADIDQPEANGSWAGFYAGGAGALGHGTENWWFADQFDPIDPNYPGDYAGNETYDLDTGFMGGGFAGYNFDLGGFVWGVEVSGLVGDVHEFVDPDYGVAGLLDVKGRVGVPVDRVLLFLEGGYSHAFYDNWFVDEDFSGFVVGAGVDVKVTDKVFVGVSYNMRMFDDIGFVAVADPDYSLEEVDMHMWALRLGFGF
jgi:outer membrane immunogenic protein